MRPYKDQATKYQFQQWTEAAAAGNSSGLRQQLMNRLRSREGPGCPRPADALTQHSTIWGWQLSATPSRERMGPSRQPLGSLLGENRLYFKLCLEGVVQRQGAKL